MATDPQLQVQKAIYDTLSGDSTLSNLIEGVFDYVPERTSFPYVTIGDDDFNESGGHTFDGVNASVTIHSWSRYRGRKEVKEIMARIYTLLHKASLTVTGYNLVFCIFDFAETIQDPDGETYHGVQRFRMFVTES